MAHMSCWQGRAWVVSLVVVIALFARESSASDDSQVVVLSDDNFEETLASKGGTWFLKFYAPWCGHCKSMAPAWEELPGLVPEEVTIGKIDVTQNSQLGKRFGIKGFPTLKVIANAGTPEAKLHDYTGNREAKSMATFVSGGYASTTGIPVPGPVAEPEVAGDGGQAATRGPSDMIVLTDGNFSIVEQMNGTVWVVMFYAPWCPHCQQMEPIWEELATKHNTVEENILRIAKVNGDTNKVSLRRMNVQGYPTVYRFEKGKYAQNDGTSKGNWESFLLDGIPETHPIPAAPTAFALFYERFQKDVIHVWQYKKMLMGLVFAFGIASGAILVAILTPVPQQPRPKSKPKPKAKPQDSPQKGSPKKSQ